jgi:hypothetical protein
MGWPGECQAHAGAACILLHFSLLVAGCIAAPPATVLHSPAVSRPASLSRTTTQPPTSAATTLFPPPNSTSISPELLAASPRRFQRSLKEQDLVDYIAIQELDRPLGEQQRYVSSDGSAGDYLGWPPADRLGWQLQPQVGKRPKRMRGQEGRSQPF